jgi:uncharacterized protein YndB with AHSA1/START domain
MPNEHKITIERDYPASVEEVWELWTSADGIAAWWAPDGFTVEVSKLDLSPGGELLYSMTATGPDQIEFMQNAGMPLRTDARKTYTDVEPGRRLAYLSLVDYAPGVEPYEHETVVDFTPSGGGVHVVMSMEPMHDEEWTQRLVAGRTNELDNLAKSIEERRRAR